MYCHITLILSHNFSTLFTRDGGRPRGAFCVCFLLDRKWKALKRLQGLTLVKVPWNLFQRAAPPRWNVELWPTAFIRIVLQMGRMTVHLRRPRGYFLLLRFPAKFLSSLPVVQTSHSALDILAGDRWQAYFTFSEWGSLCHWCNCKCGGWIDCLWPTNALNVNCI
jgi:hypothetical protein